MTTLTSSDDMPQAHTGLPARSLPAGSTDCHFHVFDSRFPTLPGRERPPSTLDDYLRYRDRLGLERAVIIAPSTYGYDNRCLFDALERMGPLDSRAVMIPPPEASWAELAARHADGVRGLRFYTGHADFPAEHELIQLAGKVADKGWHLQIVGEPHGNPVARLEPLLARLPCDLVFDHFAFIAPARADTAPTTDALFRLLDGGRAYVKLSGMYIRSTAGLPGYADFDPLAARLITRAPERLLWGSDWPHTLAKELPSGEQLLDSLFRWAPDAALRERILVSNPQRLYWQD